MKTFLAILLLFSNTVFADSNTVVQHFTNPIEMADSIEFINKYNPKLKQNVKEEIATSVLIISKKYDLSYRLVLSIIAVESSFRTNVSSSTGDYSIAQINYEVWGKELKRIKNKKLCLTRLQNDVRYSILIMGEILGYLKRYENTDPLWFARYHSKTPSLKKVYAKRIFDKNLVSFMVAFN